MRASQPDIRQLWQAVYEWHRAPEKVYLFKLLNTLGGPEEKEMNSAGRIG